MGSNSGVDAGQGSPTPVRRLGDRDKLNKALAREIRDSLLPGDTPFTKAELAEATAFVLDAAARREPGELAMHLASGSETRKNEPHGPSPSVRPASSMPPARSRKAVRAIMYTYG